MIAAHDSLQTRLAALLADDLHIAVPTPDTDLLSTGRLDSLGIVELVMQIERRFGVAIEADDLELDNFRSINSLTDFLAARLDDATESHGTGR